MTRVWIVNVTSAEGGELRLRVEAPDRSSAFEAARNEYERRTGRKGIQLSIAEG